MAQATLARGAMSAERLGKQRELGEVMGECAAVSKLDVERLGPFVKRFIGIAGDEEAAVETRVKAVDCLAGLVVAAPFGKEERVGFCEEVRKAVERSGGLELWAAFQRFEEALRKRERREASQRRMESFE